MCWNIEDYFDRFDLEDLTQVTLSMILNDPILELEIEKLLKSSPVKESPFFPIS